MNRGARCAAALLAAGLVSGAVRPPAEPATLAAPRMLAAGPPVVAQNAIQVETLAEGLALITGPGGNVIVAHDSEGAFVVDTMDADSAGAILAALDKLGAGPRRVAVNTHWHADHTDGNALFAEAGVLIVAHRQVRERRATAREMPSLRRTIPALPAHALPALTYRDSLSLHGPAGRVQLVHLPAAHTGGDSLVHFVERDLIHTGDLFEGDDFPFIDLNVGGTLSGLIDALNTTLALCGPETRVVPGHGAVASAAELRTLRDMLVETRTRVATALDNGTDPQELLDSNPLADYPAHWADGFISVRWFTALAINSLLIEREAAHPDDEQH